MVTVEVALKFDDAWRHTVSNGYVHQFNIDAHAGGGVREYSWNALGNDTATTNLYAWTVSRLWSFFILNHAP